LARIAIAQEASLMRARAAIIITAIVCLTHPEGLEACGDKLLMVVRNPRFHRAYAAVYPASIIIYAQPQRHAAKAILDPRLQADLTQAGHRVVIAADVVALERGLESGGVDLVLADVVDADHLFARAAASSSKPSVLPVMYEPTQDEIRAIETRYQCRLKTSDRPDRFLVAIDDVMKVRVERKKKTS
jgi:hypothetical protein